MVKQIFLMVAVVSLSAIFAAGQSGGAKGKIRAANGDGIPDAVVTARQDGADVQSVKTDSKGDFVISGLRPGTYNLVFSSDGYRSGLLAGFEIEADKVKDLGGRLILGVDRGTLVIINGSVYNPAGFGIAGAKVRIDRVMGDGKLKKMGTGYTSRSGEFTFTQPEMTAKFRITVSAKGTKASKDIEVEGAAIYRLAITLDLEKK